MEKKYPLMIITAVHFNDAFYASRNEVIGQVIQPKEMETDKEGWSAVTGFYNDKKGAWGFPETCVFYKVKLQEKVDEQA